MSSYHENMPHGMVMELSNLIIPPTYEVCRGYIVFAFPFVRSSVRSFVHTYVRSFVRSSFRQRVKVFALKFIRPHILKTL